MQKIRLSYSLLRLWDLGKTDDAVAYYFKTADRLESDAIVQGRAWDKIVEEQVKANNKLPEEFGGLKLNKPQTQPKKEIQLDDNFELVIVPDIQDGDRIIEIKTGGSYSSSDYARNKQVPIYLYANEDSKMGIILHYDQYIDELDWYAIHKTPRLMEETEKYIYTLGNSFKNYLEKKGLLQ